MKKSLSQILFLPSGLLVLFDEEGTQVNRGDLNYVYEILSKLDVDYNIYDATVYLANGDTLDKVWMRSVKDFCETYKKEIKK